IEVRVEPRDEPLAAAADDARGLDALLVILEALLGRQTGHADVISGFAVPFRVPEEHHINVVMVRLFRFLRLLLPRHRETENRRSVREPAACAARDRSAAAPRSRRCRWRPAGP